MDQLSAQWWAHDALKQRGENADEFVAHRECLEVLLASFEALLEAPQQHKQLNVGGWRLFKQRHAAVQLRSHRLHLQPKTGCSLWPFAAALCSFFS